MRDEARKLIVVGIRPESPKQANSSAREQLQNTFASIAKSGLTSAEKSSGARKPFPE
jgi:hypothetical protein